MSHQAVRILLEDVKKSLTDKGSFGYGRLSDYNAIKDKRYPYVWADPFVIRPQYTDNTHNYTKNFQVVLSFIDLQPEGEEDTEKQYVLVMDRMSDYADKYINKLNASSTGAEDGSIELATQKLLITNMVLDPIIKRFSDVVTGYQLSFNLLVPDTFDYCSIYD